MIYTNKRVPAIYSKESRDFQLITRLFDSILNTSKFAIDSMLNIYTNKIDNRFIKLLCKTLGFEFDGSYTDAELRGVINVFKYLVINKGQQKAIEDAVSLLLNTQNIRKSYYINWDNENKIVNIMLPYETKDLHLLDELFNYILPFGWISNNTYGEVTEEGISNQVVIKNNIRYKLIKDKDLTISNYINEDGSMDSEGLKHIGQVPENTTNKFISPTVNFDTTISKENQMEEASWRKRKSKKKVKK